jgi:hypothetical protein
MSKKTTFSGHYGHIANRLPPTVLAEWSLSARGTYTGRKSQTTNNKSQTNNKIKHDTTRAFGGQIPPGRGRMPPSRRRMPPKALNFRQPLLAQAIYPVEWIHAFFPRVSSGLIQLMDS